MLSQESAVVQLKCFTQNYAWGKIGMDSLVARLVSSSDEHIIIDDNLTYAELWMGTHRNGPAHVVETDETLESYLTRNVDFLGLRYHSLYPDAGQLPFLFKILSVGKPLSIQIHPNKTEAKYLHEKSPDKYPDCNHKPEMAIALTDFKALCAFRPIEEITSFCKQIEELYMIIGHENVVELCSTDADVKKNALTTCFCRLINYNQPNIKQLLQDVVQKIENEVYPLNESMLTFLSVAREYPEDKGCFCVFFLNIVNLAPGQAMFIDANIPHAYLSGDCLECMACSDNVIRAGFTPKFVDAVELCRLVDYTCKSKNDLIMVPKQHLVDPTITIFDPPVDEFMILQYKVPPFCRKYTIAPYDGPSILIVMDGVGEVSSCGPTPVMPIKPGNVFFVGANKTLNVKNNLEHAKMVIYRAHCSVASMADKNCSVEKL